MASALEQARQAFARRTSDSDSVRQCQAAVGVYEEAVQRDVLAPLMRQAQAIEDPTDRGTHVQLADWHALFAEKIFPIRERMFAGAGANSPDNHDDDRKSVSELLAISKQIISLTNQFKSFDAKKLTVLQASQAHREEQLTVLRQLGVNRDELSELRRQGYIQPFKRRPGTIGYARLRFRCQGRMRTIYLGNDKALIAAVQRELALLRNADRNDRNLARTVRDGKRALRKAKSKLAPILAELGFHYHGDTIRKFRAKQAERAPDSSTMTFTQTEPVNIDS